VSTPESEVEKLLRTWIPRSPFAGQTYIVGGYVRDQLLNLEGKDLDLVVEQNGGAEGLCNWMHRQAPDLISRPHPMGAGYPIWQIVFKGDISLEGKLIHTQNCEVEVADTQAESFPDPESRQRISIFGNLEADCKRRDFTTNMLYRDLTTGQLVDPSGCGESDIQDGILRGHPQVNLEKIFSDDPLRMLRLLRFHCRFGWKIPDDVLGCVSKCKSRISILSAERIRDEIIKMAESGRFHLGLKLMQETGLLECVFPELLPMIGCTQDKIFHSEGDVWTHTLLVVKNAPPDWKIQLAALLHDSGKPATRTEHGERIKFLGHEKISEEIANAILIRLHFDSESIKIIRNLVRHHMRGGDVEQWTSLKPARKLLRDVEDQLENLIKLIEADSRSSLDISGHFRIAHVEKLRELTAKAKEIPISKKGVLNGNQIMKILSIPSGKKVAEAKIFLENLEDDFASQNKILSPDEAARAIIAEFKR
jgi:poly(A) polymerase